MSIAHALEDPNWLVYAFGAPVLRDTPIDDDLFIPPTAITCALYVHGSRVPDGSQPIDEIGKPFALDGLSLTWGRASTVEQPDSAACNFTIVGMVGNDFTDLTTVGQEVRVTATAQQWTDEQQQTMPDPGFDDTPEGGVPTNYAKAYSPTVTKVTSGALQVTSTAKTPQTLVGGNLWPAPISSNPTAWDHIPRAEAGQTWHVHIECTTHAPGTTLSVGFVLADSPDGAVDVTMVWAWDPSTGPFDSTWEVNKPGYWVGLAARSWSIGYAWAAGNSSLLPKNLTWNGAAGPIDKSWTWKSMAQGYSIDNATLLAPVEGVPRTVLVFVGWITDATAAWSAEDGRVHTEVIASDLVSDLGNRDVGAEPWAMEKLSVRVGRIVTASGRSLYTRIDPGPGNYLVSRMDVDRQQVYPLLADLASSVDAVLWSAFHTTLGAYLWIEDMATRTSVRVLDQGADGIVHIVAGSAGSGRALLDACRFALDPAGWVQTTADMATRAAITWADQSPVPPEPPGEASVEIRNDAQEVAFGVRKVSLTSLVTSAADATTVANKLLARLSTDVAWRVSGLEWQIEPDESSADIETALDLLDGTLRLGAPFQLENIPDWSPIPGHTLTGYVEGGTYEFSDGRWTLRLVISKANGIGNSVVWDALNTPADAANTWQWEQMGPEIDWNDLVGVGMPFVPTLARPAQLELEG